MHDLFEKESKIIDDAEGLLKADTFSSPTDSMLYSGLLDEYRKLLKQMKSMVKMSDMMHLKLNSLSSGLERRSNVDGLTDLYNRRFFNERYHEEWDDAERLHSPLGLLMIDIDFFKKYNDTFGHLGGDTCLQKIASSIQNTVNRPTDIVARFGGEEFVVLLRGTDLSKCARVAQEILDNIAALRLPRSLEPSSEFVSVSIGIQSVIPDKGKTMDALLNAADIALYHAKEDGRNCYR